MALGMAILRATQSCALPVALLLLLFAALLLLVAVLPLLALLGRWRLAAVGRATTLRRGGCGAQERTRAAGGARWVYREERRLLVGGCKRRP